MRTLFTPALVVSVFAIAACSHEQPPPANASASIGYTETTSAPVAPPASDQTLNVGPNLRKACGIDDVNRAPKFDFDKAKLSGNDRDIASQVATCMMSGALKGHAVTLVGRADPRGSSEYNMTLGAERATAFKNYLTTLGVDASRLQDTSRGSLDANGTNEETWRHDRRVDIELAQ